MKLKHYITEREYGYFSPFLLNYFNNKTHSSSFRNHLKLANITPVHKKDSQNDQRNYRPVSVLSSISNVFKNILNQQISAHFKDIFLNNKLVSSEDSMNITVFQLWLKNLEKHSVRMGTMLHYLQIYQKHLTAVTKLSYKTELRMMASQTE